MKRWIPWLFLLAVVAPPVLGQAGDLISPPQSGFDEASADASYLRLDATNDPITAALEIQKDGSNNSLYVSGHITGAAAEVEGCQDDDTALCIVDERSVIVGDGSGLFCYWNNGGGVIQCEGGVLEARAGFEPWGDMLNPVTTASCVDTGAVCVNDTFAATGAADFESTVTNGAGVFYSSYEKIVSTDTLDTSNYFVDVDASSGDFALTLPAAGSNQCFLIWNSGASGTTTLTRAGADTIEGATTLAIATQYDMILVCDNGTSDWAVFNAAASVPDPYTPDDGTWNVTGSIDATGRITLGPATDAVIAEGAGSGANSVTLRNNTGNMRLMFDYNPHDGKGMYLEHAAHSELVLGSTHTGQTSARLACSMTTCDLGRASFDWDNIYVKNLYNSAGAVTVPDADGLSVSAGPVISGVGEFDSSTADSVEGFIFDVLNAHATGNLFEIREAGGAAYFYLNAAGTVFASGILDVTSIIRANSSIINNSATSLCPTSDGDLCVDDDLQVDGDINEVNHGFGHLYQFGSDTALTISVQNTWYAFCDGTAGVGRNTTIGTAATCSTAADGDSITVTNAGDYLIQHSTSFTGGASKDYEGAVLVNNTAETECGWNRGMGTATTVGVAAAGCILTLAASDVVELAMRGTDGTTANATLHAWNISVTRIDP